MFDEDDVKELNRLLSELGLDMAVEDKDGRLGVVDLLVTNNK